jgi:hypothetical protein
MNILARLSNQRILHVSVDQMSLPTPEASMYQISSTKQYFHISLAVSAAFCSLPLTKSPLTIIGSSPSRDHVIVKTFFYLLIGLNRFYATCMMFYEVLFRFLSFVNVVQLI